MLTRFSEMFRLFIDNSQCKHIFFAGCHDNGYLSLLTPYINKMDRITLVKAAHLSPQFRDLGLRIEEFPSVFRTTSLDNTTYSKYNNNNNGLVAPMPNSRPTPQYVENRDYANAKIVCTHFGKVCHHVLSSEYLSILKSYLLLSQETSILE